MMNDAEEKHRQLSVLMDETNQEKSGLDVIHEETKADLTSQLTDASRELQDTKAENVVLNQRCIDLETKITVQESL